MHAEAIHNTTTIYRSEHRPDVTTDDQRLADTIAWADANPSVWKIITTTKSKAFGRGSCVYIGWAQKSMAPEAILERLEHIQRLVTGREPHLSLDHIMCWRARFTFEHFHDLGFTGGFFQQHDERHQRLCLTLDYTPDSLGEVIDRFLRWCGNLHHTARITVDGLTVWEAGGQKHG
jgi:hypothetical protein